MSVTLVATLPTVVEAVIPLQPASPGKEHIASSDHINVPIVNRLYVPEVNNLFVLTDSDRIEHEPAARRR